MTRFTTKAMTVASMFCVACATAFGAPDSVSESNKPLKEQASEAAAPSAQTLYGFNGFAKQSAWNPLHPVWGKYTPAAESYSDHFGVDSMRPNLQPVNESETSSKKTQDSEQLSAVDRKEAPSNILGDCSGPISSPNKPMEWTKPSKEDNGAEMDSPSGLSAMYIPGLGHFEVADKK